MTDPNASTGDVPEVLPGLASQRNRGRRFAAVTLLTLAAIFTGIVVAVLVITALAGGSSVVVDSPLMTRIKDADAGDSETLEAIYREEDVRNRLAHDTRRWRMRLGAALLLAGLAAMVVCGRWYLRLDAALPKLHAPATAGGKGLSPRVLGVAALAGLAAMIVAALVVLHVTRVPDVEDEEPAATVTNVEPGPEPQPKPRPVLQPVPGVTYNDNWPTFRGPTGMGLVPKGDWPTTWDAASGKNIVWKTKLPLAGHSSPVIWGPRIFLSAAGKKTQAVLCYDRTNGRELWRREVSSEENRRRLAKGEEGELTVDDDTGFSASTGVTDGKRFYCMFGSADVAAVDFDGKLVWVKNFGPVDSMYGLSSSLAMHGEKIILQLDMGGSGEDKLSKLYLLAPESGAILWSEDRPVGASWSSPIVVDTGKKQLILTAGIPWVIAYDAETGESLWRFEGLDGDVAASPIYADGLVYVTNDMSNVWAIRTGGSGDVTKTHKAWTGEEGMSDAPSPVCNGKLYLQNMSQGTDVTCYDAKSGKLLWTHEMKSGYYVSPSLADDIVYLIDVEGRTQIVRLAEKFEQLGQNLLGEPVYATPAFGDGKIYIRGHKHLFCIGKTTP